MNPYAGHEGMKMTFSLMLNVIPCLQAPRAVVTAPSLPEFRNVWTKLSGTGGDSWGWF